MPPIAPLRQRRQPPLPLPPPTKAVEARSTRADCESLYLFLKTKGALGRSRGLLRREVLVGFRKMVNGHVSDRAVQRLLADAPSYGFPLASSSRYGYFIVETLYDLESCIFELESRIHEHQQRVEALERLRERFVHDRAL